MAYIIENITSNRTNVDQLVDEIVYEEPIIPESKKPQLKTLIHSTTHILFEI